MGGSPVRSSKIACRSAGRGGPSSAPTLCTTPPNVASNTCSGGACGIGSCSAGFYNVDGTVSNGCECQDDSSSTNCTAPTNGGSAAAGANFLLPSSTTFGKIPLAGGSDYYSVAFPQNSDFMMHGQGTPTVVFAANGGTEFRMEVRTAGNCTGTALACGNGGTALGDQSWTFNDSCTNAGLNCSSRSVAWPASILIRVFRAGVNNSCSQYQLRVTR